MSRPTIGLVIADTDAHALAANAAALSLQRFAFDHVLVFSDRTEPWPGLDVVRIPPLRGMADYNRLITRQVVEHLRTDFFLVCQFDGFVLNGDQFSPHFLHYDYIGAPWGHVDTFRVGNGGFSWRSRRLAEAVAALPYDPVEEAEDLFICRTQRVRLETRHGLQFAGPDLAAHFSVEAGPRHFPTFGFHGLFHLPRVYADAVDELVHHLPERVVQGDNPSIRLFREQLRAVSPTAFDRLEARRRGMLTPSPSMS